MFVSSHKYNAKRVKIGDLSFASKFEAAVYSELRLRELCGEISGLTCQVNVPLSDAKIVLRPDFKYFDKKRNQFVYAEVKGFETPEYKLKARLWEFYGPGILEVYKGSHTKFCVAKTITIKKTKG